jgi:peroxiredoxin
MEKSLDEFSAAGVRPVAISVDTPQQSAGMIKRLGLTFPILSDPNAEAIRTYHLLHTGGGPESTNISRPAEFLVDDSGTIRWTNFTEDVRVRARANQMLAAARNIR